MVSTADKQQTPITDGMGEVVSGLPVSEADHPDTGITKPAADHGPEILPAMEHFVWLVRKVRNIALLRRLLKVEGITVPDDVARKMDRAKGILPPPTRKQIFPLVAATGALTRQRLEHIAERVALLDNDYGKEAVLSLLDGSNPRDAAALSCHGDPHGRALHLHLEQEYPERESHQKARFDQAERVQVMNRQTKSEAYSSHYRGPKALAPHMDETVKLALQARILELYPGAPCRGRPETGSNMTT